MAGHRYEGSQSTSTAARHERKSAVQYLSGCCDGSSIRCAPLRLGRHCLPPLTLLLVLILADVLSIYYVNAKYSLWEVTAKMDVPLLIKSDITSGSFLSKAIESCKKTKDNTGEYPSMYHKLVPKRQQRWQAQAKRGDINFIQMINDKLGGYLYATKLGVRTPRILFCGVAKDLPRNMTSFGNKYVVKPLDGFSAKGVHVVRDGVDLFSGKGVTFNSLVKVYGPEKETIVEQLIESAHPNFDGLVPPDYKFHVFEGMSELMRVIDRNKNPKCSNYYEFTSKMEWRHLRDFNDGESGGYPQCSPRKNRVSHYLGPPRQAALTEAVRVLASGLGPNWIRIDMFDSKHGPVLGEFTPYSANGRRWGLVGCVMSELIAMHAAHAGGLTDDAETIHAVERQLGLNTSKNDATEGGNETSYPNGNDFDFLAPEAREWKQYDELTKCKKVQEAQQKLHHK